MRASSLRPGTPVRVDRGGEFRATITGEPDAEGRFPIEPLASGVGYHAATAAQIKEKLCPECMIEPAYRDGRCFECRGRSMQ